MSAAGPQVLPNSRRRASTPPPQVPEYKPDANSWSEQERHATFINEKGTYCGYSFLPHWWLADLERITNGKGQVLMLLYFLSWMDGRPKNPKSLKRDEKTLYHTPGWTSELKIEDIARHAGCDVRNAWKQMEDFIARPIPLLEFKKISPGVVTVHLLTENWHRIANSEPIPKKPIESADELEDSSDPEPEAKPQPKGAVAVIPRPVRIRSSNPLTKPFPVATGVTAVRANVRCPATAELTLQCWVMGGEMMVDGDITVKLPRGLAMAPTLVPPQQPAAPPAPRPPHAHPSAIASEKSRSNDFNSLASKNGTAVPKVQELLSECAARNATEVKAGGYAEICIAALKDSPVDWLMILVDKERATKAAAGKKFNWRHLHIKAQDAAETWAAEKARREKEVSAGTKRVRTTLSEAADADRIAMWRRTLKDPTASEVEREVALEGLREAGERV